MGQHNIIELNGKQYDAVTGTLLGESRIKAVPATYPMRSHHGRAVDGFMRMPKKQTNTTVIKPTEIPKATPAQKIKPLAGKKMDITRTTTKVVKAHQPERSKTLMRHVVSKPATQIKPAIRTTAPTEMMARPTSTLAKPLEKKLSVTQVDPVRLARARHVAKSQHIRRFSQSRQTNPEPSTARPVLPAPATAVAYKTTQQPTHAVSPSIALAKAKQELTKQNSLDVFEAALAHAVSHEQLPPKHVKRRGAHRRLVNVFAGVGAFLIIGGFIAYLNMPAITLQVASMRAGFHAQMPGYQPTGYALNGGIQSSKGKITMHFSSGDSSYQITQQASDWNSATLLDQKTTEQGTPSQTVQSKGRIIYLYDDNTATWVNGGVRYEISGNATLGANDLVSVATSM